MLYADVASLVAQTFTTSSIGDAVATETKRQVFVEVKSIGLKRKMEALATGLNIEFKLILADVQEYQGEKLIEYRNKRYNIVNVYVADDQSVELTLGLYTEG